jgi:hypothetical protein
MSILTVRFAALLTSFCRQVHVCAGCYDWHSAVHSHWLLVCLLRRGACDADTHAHIIAALSAHLTPTNISAEVAALAAGQLEYELPYGFAWLLTLCRELALCRSNADLWGRVVSEWSSALVPLEQAVRVRIQTWAQELQKPCRQGVHRNSAFAICLSLDYARVSCVSLMAPLEVAALRWFGNDRFADEPPPGTCFLSPRLTEIAAMLSAMVDRPINEALAWLFRKVSTVEESGLTPSPLSVCAPLQRLMQTRLAEPVSGDPRLPFESHLIGLVRPLRRREGEEQRQVDRDLPHVYLHVMGRVCAKPHVRYVHTCIEIEVIVISAHRTLHAHGACVAWRTFWNALRRRQYQQIRLFRATSPHHRTCSLCGYMIAPHGISRRRCLWLHVATGWATIGRHHLPSSHLMHPQPLTREYNPQNSRLQANHDLCRLLQFARRHHQCQYDRYG